MGSGAFPRIAASSLVFAVCAFSASASYCAEHVNPNQGAIDALADQKALVDAQNELAKSEAGLAKSKFSGFGDNFGKTGAVTVESAERDKFHITAKSAEAFPDAAKQILAALPLEEAKPVVLLTEADRNSVPIYWSEKIKLDRLASAVDDLLGKEVQKAEKEGNADLLGIGSLLSEVAQFTQLFRTDKSVAFAESSLPDELLLDLIAQQAPTKVIYPSAAMDALWTGGVSSNFGSLVSALFKRRGKLSEFSEKAKGKKDQTAAAAAASAALADLDALATSLATPDVTTKIPLLLTVFRGEFVAGALTSNSGRALTVKVAEKGGASLKTSSIWHSDRLYASGGVVATYRLTSGGTVPTVTRAGVVVSETKFVRVPLD